MQIVKYKPASLGLGTESSSKLQPLDFSPSIINRFYNYLGDLEKRRGLTAYGALIVPAFAISTAAGVTTSSVLINNIHEYVDVCGNNLLFASGITNDNFGAIWRYSTTANSWVNYTTNSYPNNIYYSVQMNDKLIFCNGAQSNFYITVNTSGALVSDQLYATVIKGISGTASSAKSLTDPDITNWKTQTKVAVNDLMLTNINDSFSSPQLRGALITSVGTTSLDITNIGVSGEGLGAAFTNFSSNKAYRIIDLVELNIIPTSALPGGVIFDNIAIAGASTSAGAVSVTGVNLAQAGLKAGDYIYNSTRAAVAKVFSVSINASLFVSNVSGQVPGDSIVFLKDAMPLTSFPHVHYGRLHLIDARDPTKIRVSGPNDPEDFTTFSQTLSSVTIDYSSRQPKSDTLLTLSTFQRYLVAGSKNALFVTDGTNPIADTTADVIDLDPVGLFPQGVFSPKALQSIGNEMLYIGYDGMRSFLAAFDSKNTTTNNISEQIKTELINALQIQANTNQNVQLIHYPRRNWVMMKIGNIIYNYNYTPTYNNGKINTIGTFTKFTGTLGEQTAFLTLRSGDLFTAGNVGNNAKVYQFDVSGVYTDDGTNIATTYISPWHTLQEAETNADIIVKDGRYIRPVFETSAAIKYNISVVGDFAQLATDSVVVTSEVSGITNPKMPLRWRGKQAQFTITTDTSVGNDIINSYTVYGNVFGRK